MTGYPPKCPQNGTRNHKLAVRDTEYNYTPPDAWPGDTATFPNGNVWRMNRDGKSWTLIAYAATEKAA